MILQRDATVTVVVGCGIGPVVGASISEEIAASIALPGASNWDKYRDHGSLSHDTSVLVTEERSRSVE